MSWRRGRPSRHDAGFVPVRVLSLELSGGVPETLDVAGYQDALILLRHEGAPLGCLQVACPGGKLTAQQVWAAIEADGASAWRLASSALRRWLLPEPSAPTAAALPSWSAVVCTRDRTDVLGRCLDALLAASRGQRDGEIIVVDNDPSDDGTRRLVMTYAGRGVRYVCERRRGLNWARACAAREARGEILLYTDDDAVVDPGWIGAIRQAFDAPRIGAVTGLTMPYEVETPAQALFEFYGGHGRGFSRRVFDSTVIAPAAAGLVGSGANMAIRRDLAVRLRLFECELDVGTVTRSGGDAYGFYLLMRHGYQIVYAPSALAWHAHRRDYPALRRMLYGYTVGAMAFLTRCLVQHRDPQAVWAAVCWFRQQHLRQLRRALLRRRDALPIDLVLAEWQGLVAGPLAYWRSRGPERRHRPGAVSMPQEAAT